jgi:signal transduction histidine kinase
MFRSVRARAVLGAVAAVALALVVGAVGMVLLVRSSLTDNVRQAAELRAEDVATALEEGGFDAVDLGVEDDDEAFIQVVDGGTVVAASENAEDLGPLADLGDEDSTVVDDVPVGDDRFVVVAVEAELGDDEVLVLVGRALEDVGEATWAVVQVLVAGIPLLLVLVGVVANRVVRRALAPVRAMTDAAEEITATDLARRLPEPEGRDEIARLAETLNAMLGRLADSRDRLTAFVADAAHELRSPVASIRQHSEVAQAHPEQADAGELADVVHAESLRLQRLVDDLLLLARGDAGARQRFDQPVDLDDVVGAAVARLRPVSAAVIDTSGVSGGQVRGDAGALDRLVGNLLENAVRHAEGRVAVSLVEDATGVTLTVDDDGPGIPEADRARVFERFVRLDEARSRDAGGSGLGLAIVAAVAVAHGARVLVDAAPLGGARFRVVFPDPG